MSSSEIFTALFLRFFIEHVCEEKWPDFSAVPSKSIYDFPALEMVHFTLQHIFIERQNLLAGM
jgi:hypothetical protein